MRSKLIVWRNLLLATLFQSTTTRVTEMSSSRFGNCDQSAWPCETDDLERWIEDALEDIRRIFESCPTDYKCVYKECPPYGNLDYRRSVPQLSGGPCSRLHHAGTPKKARSPPPSSSEPLIRAAGSVCEPMWTRVAVMLFDRLITNCTRIFEFGGGASTPVYSRPACPPACSSTRFPVRAACPLSCARACMHTVAAGTSGVGQHRRLV